MKRSRNADNLTELTQAPDARSLRDALEAPPPRIGGRRWPEVLIHEGERRRNTVNAGPANLLTSRIVRISLQQRPRAATCCKGFIAL